MNTTLLRYTLALFLCGIATTAISDNDANFIINEDFSDMPSGWQNSFNGWTLSTAKYVTPKNSTNKILKIEKKSETVSGYAITKDFNYSGAVLLSLSFGSNQTTSGIKMTIQNGGTFDDNIDNKIIDILNRTDENLDKCEYIIIGTGPETNIKFEQIKINNTLIPFYIDDVKVIKLGEITLNEDINSSEAINANSGRSCNVETKRTLLNNKWNTLCLPFDVTKATMEAALGSDKDIQMRTYSSYDATNKIMSFDAVAEDATITAGTPFLVKFNYTENIANPTFESVTISDTPAKAIGEDGSAKFVGTYSPIDLNTDGTHLFITTSGNVAKPASNQNHMKGLRAYIDVTNSSGVRLSIEDETTDIQQIAFDEEKPTTLYSLNGQRLQTLKKGIIIRDGKLTFTK